jgi:hypothetical protein
VEIYVGYLFEFENIWDLCSRVTVSTQIESPKALTNRISKISHKLGVILDSSFLSDIQNPGVSVGESSMTSSSIRTRSSSDEESLSCPSSILPPDERKKPVLEIDLSCPGPLT